jgi:hypothetical protein
MEIEDYGLVVSRRDSLTGDAIQEIRSLELPLPYPGGPCVFWIRFQEQDVLLISIAKNGDGTETFHLKLSVWEDGEAHLKSESFDLIIHSPQDLRLAILHLSEPLIEKYQAHFAQSFRTHFARLKTQLDLQQNTPGKAPFSLKKTDT